MYRKGDENVGGICILLIAAGPLYEPQFSFLIYKMGVVMLNSWSCED